MNKQTKAKLEKVLDSLELSKENKNNLRDIFEECSASGGGKDVVIIKQDTPDISDPDTDISNMAKITVYLNNIEIYTETLTFEADYGIMTIISANLFNCVVDNYTNREYILFVNDPENKDTSTFMNITSLSINTKSNPIFWATGINGSGTSSTLSILPSEP